MKGLGNFKPTDEADADFFFGEDGYSFNHPVHQCVGILRKVEIFCGDEFHDFLGFVFTAHILLGVQFRTFFHLPQMEHFVANLLDPQIHDFTPIHRKQPVQVLVQVMEPVFYHKGIDCGVFSVNAMYKCFLQGGGHFFLVALNQGMNGFQDGGIEFIFLEAGNEAALRAVRAGRKSVTQSDLEESIEVVIAGYQKKNSILTDQEKCIVAYHEIGHALVAAKQSHSAPVQKITIIPRTSGALGYTMQVDEGNHYLMNQTELENKIATFTGGRAAEELVFHSVTTGASNDIEQATKLARAMITRYGMSQDFDMVALETVNNQYLGGDTSLACSAQTQREIDQKVVELVKAQHAKALQILTENRDKLDQLAKFLYEKETITGEEFMAILNGEEKTE